MSINNCPHCHYQNNANIMWCEKCKKVMPLLPTNLFEVLSLPQQFGIDLQQLESRFLIQLKQTHPDRFIGRSKLELEIALQNSFIINQAYKTLKSAYLRLEHLLKIQGLDIEQQTEISDFEFLESTFKWREELNDASSLIEIQELISSIQRTENEEFAKAAKLITEKLYNEAMQVYIKLKFVKRFLAEAQACKNEYETL